MARTLRLLLSTFLLAASVAGQQEPFHANISPGKFVQTELALFRRSLQASDFDINALRLVQFSLDGDPIWMTEGTKLDVKRAGQTFFDMCGGSSCLSSII